LEVTVRKQCAVCSEPFEAKRNTAKYCSKRCNVRAARQPKPKAALAPAQAQDVPSLLLATLAELEQAGRQASASGVAALVLAARVDAGGGETGAGLAALAREHAARLADALENVEPSGDPVEDELRAARERKRAIAGG
jgi:hypothetical protein